MQIESSEQEKKNTTSSFSAILPVKSLQNIYLSVIQIHTWNLCLYHLSALINLTHMGKDNGSPNVNRDNTREKTLRNSSHQ